MTADFDLAKSRRTLFEALLDARHEHGGNRVVLEDQDREPMNYTGLIRAAFALGRKLQGMTEPGEHVGVLLPTSRGVVVTFFALHAIGRIPVMLNFTSGARNLKSACASAKVKTILTSKRFVAQARLEDLIEELDDVARISWLEDIRKTIGGADKIYALLAGTFPHVFAAKAEPDDAAVILFTSGSFGSPKGVVLTHANLLANCAQVAKHIAIDKAWIWFNPLPTFHSFGLTGGVLIPVMEGLRSFQYPSPLHYKVIPELIRETQASVLLSTDTFVNQYARACEPEDMASLQFLVCGAERVRPETHALINEKLGIPIVEGYGVTEASPVVAVNKPDDNRAGTVGAMIPGIETRLEPVPGISGGGLLFIKGPNVMAGYLKEDGSLDAPTDGWYDTGDVVSIDQDGWVRILGRVKRFAKVGGEMVSLAAVEELCTAVWPGARHSVVSVADPKKGERLVLVTDHKEAVSSALLAHARSVGAPELAVPKRILKVHELPVLGTGKTDYVAIQRMAEADAAG